MPREFIPRVHAFLDGVHSAVDEANHHADSVDTLALPIPDVLEEFVDLFHLLGARKGVPGFTDDGPVTGVRRQSRGGIGNIKPSLIPAFQGGSEVQT